MSWAGVTSVRNNMRDNGLGKGTDLTETSMESNLQDIHLEGDVERQAVSIGEVGAPTRFRHIKNNKYMRRLYLVLAALAGIFVFSALLRLSVKSNKKSSSGNVEAIGSNGMDFDLSGSSIRESHLLILVKDIVVDEAERADLTNFTSPQRQALRWLADEDARNIEIPETRFDAAYPAFLQRYSSAVLAFAWGVDVLAPLGFLTGSDVCEWNVDFERPDGSILTQGLICNPDQNKIIKVVLQTVGLSGPIPRELGNLHAISHLHLDENKLVGHLPQTMRHLSALREFTVTRNQLSGHLPPFLAKMKKLRHMELSKNRFSGHLSYSFGALGTEDETADVFPSPLRVLAIDNNKFNGPIDSLKAFVTLEELYLNDNALTGQVGKTFTELAELAIVDASNNHLSGKIPDYMLQLPSMTILDLHSNAFDGQLPHGNSTQLKFLDLHSNALVSVIPRSFGEHPNLAYLDLSYNQLEGELIEEMGQLKSLQFLFLSNNPTLTPATIPEWIVQLPILESLSLKNTARIGALPDWFGDLKQLSLLDLENNFLNGTIPVALEGAEGLEYLFLNRNNFVGQVPGILGNLTDLVLLNLDHNGLTGAMPASVCALGELDVLIADCDTDGDEAAPQIECACCTKCCLASADNCNTRDWNNRYGEDWAGYYERFNIVEDGDVFEIVSDNGED